MKKKSILFLTVAAMLLVACGGKPAETPSSEKAPDPQSSQTAPISKPD